MIFKTREELDHAVVTMHGDGLSKRALAKKFKMSRNTIRKIINKNQKNRDQGHSALNGGKVPGKSKLDPHIPRIENLLNLYPKITGQRLFEELRDDGYTGGITILRERLADLRPHPKKTPIIRFETLPGEQSQMDWSPYTINFAANKGKSGTTLSIR